MNDAAAGTVPPTASAGTVSIKSSSEPLLAIAKNRKAPNMDAPSATTRRKLLENHLDVPHRFLRIHLDWTFVSGVSITSRVRSSWFVFTAPASSLADRVGPHFLVVV